MKIPFFGLSTGILAQLVFLIIAAMLLVNVVMLNFAERDLVRAKIDTYKLLILAIEQILGNMTDEGKRPLKETNDEDQFRRNLSRILSIEDRTRVTIVDSRGDLVFTNGALIEKNQPGLTFAVDALGTRSWSIKYDGNAWGVLWLGKRYINLSAPLIYEGRLLGGIAISSTLEPVYQILRKSEKFILLYIVLDTVILVIVGVYILSRIVVKPIRRLLKLTEGYRSGDIILPIPEDSKNEIGNLTRSLRSMLQRLDENKRELKGHIASLEVANRELKQAQDEIIRSEKLASVGRLTAGIAHEIGNPIGIVEGYLELIKKGDISEEERNDFIIRAESEINRVDNIIRQLLDFSRSSSGKKEVSHIHELIINTVNILKPQPMMEGIGIKLDFGADRDRVFADPNQLQQVFLNIIINAADVLSENKTPMELTIMTEDSADTIEVRFKDNGRGIAGDDLIHIFDPFYTTKDPGKGTGLGLSVCYRIVEGHGGKISAESLPGEGTTIIIRLPLHPEPCEKPTDS